MPLTGKCYLLVFPEEGERSAALLGYMGKEKTVKDLSGGFFTPTAMSETHSIADSHADQKP